MVGEKDEVARREQSFVPSHLARALQTPQQLMHGKSRRRKSFQTNGFLWPGEQISPRLNLLANSIKFPFITILRAPAGALGNIWPAEEQSPYLCSQWEAWTGPRRITVRYTNAFTLKATNHSGLRRPSWDIAVPRNPILWDVNSLAVLERLVNHDTILSKPPKSTLNQAGEKKPLLYGAKKRFLISGR